MPAKTNCTKNGKDYFRVSLTLGRDENGKSIKQEFYGKNKAEAENKKAEFIKDRESGLNTQLRKQLLAPCMRVWLDVVVDDVKPTTKEKYKGILKNYINQSLLANIPLKDVTNILVKKYYADLRKNGKRETQILSVNKILKKFFYYCMAEGAITRNPCFGIKIKKKTAKAALPVFKSDEIKKILPACEGNRLKSLIYMAFGTGAREGELFALSWNDVDFKNSKISINKTANKVTIEAEGAKERKVSVTTPKTENSVRSIPVPSNVIKVLRIHKAMQEIEKKKFGELYNDKKLVFCTELGNYLDQRNMQRAYVRILKAANVPYRKFHAIRHTYATQLFERGVPLKTVSMLLGHSSIKITADTYIDVLENIKVDEISKINEIFA